MTAAPPDMKARFGLSLSTRAVLFDWATLDDLLDMAVTAEGSGCFHGVWVGDNLLSKPRLEAIVTLSALAARTERLKLGTVCLASFALRDPILLALQWASLDVLSHGRTILAVCNGGSARDGPQFAHELAVMGVESRERVGRVVEGIEVLRRLWSEPAVTHAGRYHRFADVALQPKPVQARVPIHLAVNPREGEVDEAAIDRILQRVATHADGWQTDATPPATFRKRIDAIRRHAEARGRDGAALEASLHLMVNINENRDRAFEEATRFLELLLRRRRDLARARRDLARLRPARAGDRQDRRLCRSRLHDADPALRRPRPARAATALHRGGAAGVSCLARWTGARSR